MLPWKPFVVITLGIIVASVMFLYLNA